jgi:hypothetical protein
MATSHVPAAAAVARSDRAFNPVLTAILCAVVVAVAMGSLWIGVSGLTGPDPAGGLLRTLGGIAGFYVIFGLTLVAAVRQK